MSAEAVGTLMTQESLGQWRDELVSGSQVQSGEKQATRI